MLSELNLHAPKSSVPSEPDEKATQRKRLAQIGEISDRGSEVQHSTSNLDLDYIIIH